MVMVLRLILRDIAKIEVPINRMSPGWGVITMHPLGALPEVKPFRARRARRKDRAPAPSNPPRHPRRNDAGGMFVFLRVQSGTVGDLSTYRPHDPGPFSPRMHGQPMLACPAV